MKADSEAYLAKKAEMEKMLTLYGRNAVLEALQDERIACHKLHISRSNRPARILAQIEALAKARGIEAVTHDKQSLSRISKNAKQDQGVALDIQLPFSGSLEAFLVENEHYRIIALDGITNPQNLGMIIRSCAAGNVDALLLPTKGNAQISPLVIKASAGTLFKIPLLRTRHLASALKELREQGAACYTLASDAEADYDKISYDACSVFVLGSESEGVSREIREICDKSIAIPMQRGVESLNVAVTAALLAFMGM